jgi:hypothetical protein
MSAPAIGAPMRPVGPWVLDYAETQCLAYRGYGNPKRPVTLGIRPAPNGQTYELLLGRQSGGPDFAEELKGKVDFGFGSIRPWLLHFRDNKNKRDVYQYRISAAEMARAGSANQVALGAEGEATQTFTLAAMPALLAGLQKCTENLKQYWNMGRQRDEQKARPSGDLRGLFSPGDYPGEALRLNQSGSSQFLLLIDEKGKVAGCHVERPSGVPVLDVMGCQVVRERAKFVPARDSNGTPVRSTLTTPPITWRIEG